jgi:hypothetical protein
MNLSRHLIGQQIHEPDSHIGIHTWCNTELFTDVRTDPLRKTSVFEATKYFNFGTGRREDFVQWETLT